MTAKRFFLVLSIILFFVFIFYSYLVAKEIFVSHDFNTTVKIQDHISRRWDYPFSVLSILGSVEITSILWLGLLIYSLLKRFWLTFISLPLYVIGLSIEVFGKLFVLHPGPPFLFFRGVITNNFPSHYIHTDYSYPSGHLFRTSFLVCFLLGLIYFRFKGNHKILLYSILIFFLFLMVVSRVYLGEHWTTDVIGGTLLGSSLGIFCSITVPYSKQRLLVNLKQP